MKLNDLTYDPELFIWYSIKPNRRYGFQICQLGKAWMIYRRDVLKLTPWEPVQGPFISAEAAAAHLELDATPFAGG
jgi:hypothetical protein